MAEQVTNVGGVGLSALWIALIWLGLSVAVAAGIVLCQRLLIMWRTGHGWVDAGVLLRQRSRRALHARIERDRPITRAPRMPQDYHTGIPVTGPDGRPGTISVVSTDTLLSETITVAAADGDVTS